MRAVTDLEKLRVAISCRLIRLRRLYSSLPARSRSDRTLVTSVAVMELDNLVLGGLRQFMISSLRGGRTCSGLRVRTNRSFGQEGEIAAYALQVLNSVRYNRLNQPASITRRDEQTIRDPRDMAKVFQACAATNLPSLDVALSLNSPLFRDLGTFRNFYAHRNDDTCRKAYTKGAVLGLTNFQHTDDIVTSSLIGRPVSIYEDWLDDAELFFEELTR